MKIKFNADDNIPLNKIMYLPTIPITKKEVSPKKIINVIHKSS